ncbi:MAG: hypothetical protein ACK5BV_03420 [Bacteroidota bacterium]
MRHKTAPFFFSAMYYVEDASGNMVIEVLKTTEISKPNGLESQ